MTGIRSATYKTKRSDRTLTGAKLEMEILSQCGQSILQIFRPSCMNHGKGSVVGQLVPVEHNRLTVSDNISIDKPAGGYMELVEYRNSARGHLIALKTKVHGILPGGDDMRHNDETRRTEHWSLLKCTQKR